MATITLSRHECAGDLLPKVCAECGTPAAGTLAMNFSWTPRWANWLFVVWFFVMKTMLVRMPFCDNHRRVRRRRNVWFIVLFFAIIASMALSCYCMVRSPASMTSVPAACALGVSVALFWAWVVTVIVIDHRDIQATHITDRSLTLDRVHEAFVAAVVEVRDHGDPDAHRRFGDLRDDFDDADDRPREK
jgi:hypothetical protein